MASSSSQAAAAAAAAPPPHQGKPIHIREVWAHNLESEFKLLGAIIDEFPFVSMDTEFPGIIEKFVGGRFYRSCRSPTSGYTVLKLNIPHMKLIQLGLTLADEEGNLPDLELDGKNTVNTPYRYIWEFNFKDFDIFRDRNSPRSIRLLVENGIDFETNRAVGVDSVKFAKEMMSSGLVCNDSVTWITFDGIFDNGLLIKILSQEALPEEVSAYLDKFKSFFGRQVYDVDGLVRNTPNIFGGLEAVAKMLGIAREAGQAHQAGSDSLLTMRVFQKLSATNFSHGRLNQHAGDVPVLGRLPADP